MSEKSLKELFIAELRDMYDAEHRLTKILPKFAKASNSAELSAAFREHLEQTEQHIVRLESVMELVDQAPKRKTCHAMVGLIEEAQDLMHQEGSPNLRDAALIAAALKIEHYEMATYLTLRNWVDVMKSAPATKLLQKTLDEETATTQKLTEVAKSLRLEWLGSGDDDELAAATVNTGTESVSLKKPRTR